MLKHCGDASNSHQDTVCHRLPGHYLTGQSALSTVLPAPPVCQPSPAALCTAAERSAGSLFHTVLAKGGFLLFKNCAAHLVIWHSQPPLTGLGHRKKIWDLAGSSHWHQELLDWRRIRGLAVLAKGNLYTLSTETYPKACTHYFWHRLSSSSSHHWGSEHKLLHLVHHSRDSLTGIGTTGDKEIVFRLRGAPVCALWWTRNCYIVQVWSKVREREMRMSEIKKQKRKQEAQSKIYYTHLKSVFEKKVSYFSC